MGIFTLLLSVISFQLSTGLIAYNCNQPANITKFSLSDLAKCPELMFSYVERISTVHVTEVQDVKETLVQICLVEIETIISKCNNSSDALNSTPATIIERLPVKVHLLGPEKCMIAHKHSTLIINDVSIGGININNVTDIRMTTLRGSLNRDGKCVGENYRQDGREWNNVVAQVNGIVKIMTYKAAVHLDYNEIKLKGGTICTYLDGYCVDSTYGETVWKYIPEQVVHEGDYMIYNGSASIIADGNNRKHLVFETDGIIVTLELVRNFAANSLSLNKEIWQTEHPKLVVKIANTVLSSNKTFASNVTLLSRYLNSKYVYAEKRHNQTSIYIHLEIVHRRCLHQQSTVMNRLLITISSPNIANFLFKDKLGMVGKILGDSLYMQQCVPKVVTLRNDTRCYNELPIRVDGRNMFASPFQYVIQESAEELECNSIVPPTFFIDNKCLAFNREYSECEPPASLSPYSSLWDELTFSTLQRDEDRGEEAKKVGTNTVSLLNVNYKRKVLGRQTRYPNAVTKEKLNITSSIFENFKVIPWSNDDAAKLLEVNLAIVGICGVFVLVVIILAIIRCFIIVLLESRWHVSCFLILCRVLGFLKRYTRKNKTNPDEEITPPAMEELVMMPQEQ